MAKSLRLGRNRKRSEAETIQVRDRRRPGPPNLRHRHSPLCHSRRRKYRPVLKHAEMKPIAADERFEFTGAAPRRFDILTIYGRSINHRETMPHRGI